MRRWILTIVGVLVGYTGLTYFSTNPQLAWALTIIGGLCLVGGVAEIMMHSTPARMTEKDARIVSKLVDRIREEKSEDAVVDKIMRERRKRDEV